MKIKIMLFSLFLLSLLYGCHHIVSTKLYDEAGKIEIVKPLPYTKYTIVYKYDNGETKTVKCFNYNGFR